MFCAKPPGQLYRQCLLSFYCTTQDSYKILILSQITWEADITFDIYDPWPIIIFTQLLEWVSSNFNGSSSLCLLQHLFQCNKNFFFYLQCSKMLFTTIRDSSVEHTLMGIQLNVIYSSESSSLHLFLLGTTQQFHFMMSLRSELAVTGQRDAQGIKESCPQCKEASYSEELCPHLDKLLPNFNGASTKNPFRIP